MNKETIENYFEMLVKYQPNDVVDLLVKLFDKQINYQDWINDTYNDVIDSQN